METIIISNVIAIFKMDTFICSMNGTKLEQYMKNKHKWSDTQWKEYYTIYRDSFLVPKMLKPIPKPFQLNGDMAQYFNDMQDDALEGDDIY